MNMIRKNSRQTLEQQFCIQYSYPVFFSHNIFREDDPLLSSVFLRAGEKSHSFLCFLDSGVLAECPSLISRIENYAEKHQTMNLPAPVFMVEGGEACKNDPRIIDTLIRHIKDHRICRHSFIVAIGGGAVLDAVGYAAAIAHRGVRLIRMPTTVLAQNDAGIGVKNGINMQGRKNFIGTFAPPFAVINDFSFLETLPVRELRSGIAEAVKVALIKDKEFFASLYEKRTDLASFGSQSMEDMIHRCAALHMAHIGGGGDPFELGSARPLDFGHWSAHKLEEITRGALIHGEAVSVGMALDSLYSHYTGILREDELRRIFSLLGELGLPLAHPALADLDVRAALGEFQEHLGGEMAITLLTGIGSKKEVNWIDTSLMQRCVDELLQHHGSEGPFAGLTGHPPLCGEMP